MGITNAVASFTNNINITMERSEDIQPAAVSGCTSRCVCMSRRHRHNCRRLDIDEGHCLCCVRLQQNAVTVQRYAAAEGATRGSVVLSVLSGWCPRWGEVNRNTNGRGQCVTAITMHSTAAGQS
jgi:hypothetical protein